MRDGLKRLAWRIAGWMFWSIAVVVLVPAMPFSVVGDFFARLAEKAEARARGQ